MSELLNIDYTKFTLSNGLEVTLYKNDSFPTVAVNLWYKVGSANEIPTKTGFAHLFEHMMFQGSENVPKEKHFSYIQEVGGTLNGSTSMDRTNYYETLPADSLELALWLESDRMGFLLEALTQEKLDNQKDVVMNERRQNYDNQPYGLAWELLFSNLFPEEHPYHWPTIGWMKDIEMFELDDVRKFFITYYSPNNASLVIGGNFDKENAKLLVEKYFGNIKRNIQIPEINFPKVELKQNKKIIHQDNVQLSRIYLGWHSCEGYHEDDASLDILADVLSGSKNSRLYKELVYEKQIAQSISCFQYSAKLDGSFFIIATAKPGVELEALKSEIINLLNDVIEEGVKENEIQRAKNSYESSFIYSLQNLSSITNHINDYNCNLGEPDSFNFDLERYTGVTKTSIKHVAKKYLTKNYVELNIIPK